MKRIDELTRQRVKTAYLNSAGLKTKIVGDLARQYGVSEPTINRWVKEEDWEGLRRSRINAVSQTVKSVLSEASTREDIDERGILNDVISKLYASVSSTNPRSQEGVASALAKVLTLYRERFPLSMEDLADIALSTPGFEPRKFAQILRDRYDARRSAP